jgi:hypothetical protein
MPNEAQIRALARGVLQTRTLPRRDPDRTWDGKGVGLPCTVCGMPISPAETEYELQFSHDGAAPRLDRFHLHLRGFAAWEMERTKVREGRGAR